MEKVVKLDLVGFDTNHGHRHFFPLHFGILKKFWSTYILEITLTASNLVPTCLQY